jgi:hypothetical protein
VLALGYIAEEQNPGCLRNWAIDWHEALTKFFPDEADELASRIGGGLRELVSSTDDFDEAYHTCVNGLLSAFPVDQQILRETGERILGDACERLEELV